MQQLTDEWFSARLGKVTASRVADVMAKTKSGYSASRANYMMELLCQRLTGQRVDSYTNAAMQRGTDLEPLARSAYEVETGETVIECGLVLHPDCVDLGASPDGLVGASGVVEIKCPNTAQHVACIQSGKADSKYILQMQTQLACTGREWCDFVSFDDRMPEALQLFRCRVMRDEKLIKEILAECELFLSELRALHVDMLEKMQGKAA